ncbi:MAG TPA: hypothetical protein VED59_05475 [Acidimicrobiales bacterium]|nr:hypothetical protein [Acidimicrobiales bacterium]
MAEMRDHNAGPLIHFLAGLDDKEAESFITHFGEIVAALNKSVKPTNGCESVV